MSEQFDLIVIGAGPGGYVAAIRAAQLGLKTACVEKQYLGGTCLNVGCIPSKALLESSELFETAQHKFKEHGIAAENLTLDFPKMIARKDRVVKQLTTGIGGLFKKNKIAHFAGEAKILGSGKVEVTTKQQSVGNADLRSLLSAKHIIIATGSVPVEIPSLPFDHENIIDSTDALSLAEVPQSMIVIGGGVIGLEMGSVYLRLGSKITVIEAMDRIVPGMDLELCAGLHKVLTRQGMDIKVSHKVLKAEVKDHQVNVTVQTPDGKEEIMSASKVLVAVGRKAFTGNLGAKEAGLQTDERGRIVVNEHYQTSLANVYAVGDVIAGPMLAHKASEEGVALVEQLAGHKTKVNYHAIPCVVYTWPEVASVGFTEEEVKAKNIEYKVAKFPFMANGRAISMSEKDGFVKLIADKKTDQLLGAHILGPRASDMIAELVLAIEFGATSEDVAMTIHAHPSLAEAVKEAALGLGTGFIHF